MNWLCNDLPRRTNVRQLAGVNGVASQLPTLGKGCPAEAWPGQDELEPTKGWATEDG